MYYILYTVYKVANTLICILNFLLHVVGNPEVLPGIDTGELILTL